MDMHLCWDPLAPLVEAYLIALSGKTPETFRFERDVFRCPRGYLWAKGEDAWWCVTHSSPDGPKDYRFTVPEWAK